MGNEFVVHMWKKVKKIEEKKYEKKMNYVRIILLKKLTIGYYKTWLDRSPVYYENIMRVCITVAKMLTVRFVVCWEN